MSAAKRKFESLKKCVIHKGNAKLIHTDITEAMPIALILAAPV
jgi:hypothetical protein